MTKGEKIYMASLVFLSFCSGAIMVYFSLDDGFFGNISVFCLGMILFNLSMSCIHLLGALFHHIKAN